MRTKQAILLALIISALWGCGSDKLSRGKAEELIRASYKFPNDEIEAFTIGGTGVKMTLNNYKAKAS